MNKRFAAISSLMIMLLILSFSIAQTTSSGIPLHIGVIFDGPWDKNQELFELIKKEVTDVAIGNYKIIFPADKCLVGDWSVDGSRNLNEQLLTDPEVDLIIGFGVFSSQDLAQRGSLPKPIIAPIVINPEKQHIPIQAGTSGIHNLNYLVYPQTFIRDFSLFREMVPFKKLVFLTSKRFHDGVPPTRPDDEEISKVLGSAFVTIRFDDYAEHALAVLPADADAVYLDVIPLSRVEFEKLVHGLIARRLISFSSIGETEVRAGIMFAANPDIFPRMIRRIALNIQRIMMGEDPGSLAVNFPAGKKLYINVTTANSIGIFPKWTTLLEAELINPVTPEPSALHLPLASAIQRISTENLDVQSKMKELNAQQKNIALARSILLPQLDLNATGVQIDQDRAAAAYMPERTATAEISLNQVLFSESAFANLSIQSSLYRAKENEFEANRLNNIMDGAAAYLNYLRVKKIYLILLDNLRVTRSNLELAQIRQSTGVAGAEEPLRWEIEIARMRQDVMALHSLMTQTGFILNQILNLPLSQPLNLDDLAIDDATLFISDKKLQSYLEDPLSLAILTEYMVKEGLDRAHELHQLDAVIQAQQRALTSSRNAFFLPNIGAFVRYNNNFYKSSQPRPFQLSNIPAPPAGLDPSVPPYLGQLFSAVTPDLPDRHDWTVGIQFSFRVFSGLSKLANEQKAGEQLKQYQLQRQATADRLALRIRSEMQNAKSTYFAIHQTRLRLEAARKTLDLVTDSYSRGAVSILNLLDAQNAQLYANQLTTHAYYDFMITYFQLQRAMGQFDMLITPEKRDEFLQKLIQFMETTRKP
jgi:outer membrane protein